MLKQFFFSEGNIKFSVIVSHRRKNLDDLSLMFFEAEKSFSTREKNVRTAFSGSSNASQFRNQNSVESK